MVAAPAEQEVAALKIKSALINPAGTDAGRETITLLNPGSQDISLEGWLIRNQVNRVQPLSGTISAHSERTIPMDSSKIMLTNKGGTLVLISAAGEEVDKVTYTKSSVKSGVQNVF